MNFQIQNGNVPNIKNSLNIAKDIEKKVSGNLIVTSYYQDPIVKFIHTCKYVIDNPENNNNEKLISVSFNRLKTFKLKDFTPNKIKKDFKSKIDKINKNLYIK